MIISEKEKLMQAVLDKTADGKKIFGTAFAVKKDGVAWTGASGNMSAWQPYFIASTTKLFTTAIILKLISEDRLSLDDRISEYIGSDILKDLHVFRGKHYEDELTITHLLAHTSGLPDYFQNKGTNGKSLEDEIVSGIDQSWTFEQAIDRTKALKPLFPPGTKNKAHYSDSNFQLLGKIIETITGKSYSVICNSLVIEPLGLTGTYLYSNPADKTPKCLYYKSRELNIPNAMTSFGADGGIVSTSSDMLVFIEAFFTGRLFPAGYLSGLKQWNRIFFPMQSGIGIHMFSLPWFFNPTGTIPPLFGHSGLSGALAFCNPGKNLYFTGTVNQVAHPDISFRTMIKLAQVLLRK